MAGSRRKYKRSRTKVRVGLPKKHPNVFKPSFNIPPKLRTILEATGSEWDDKGTVLSNYKSFGFVSNPNLLSVRSRTPHIIEAESMQVPQPLPNKEDGVGLDEFEPIEAGSDLEEDDLRTALGKKRKDGNNAPPQPLTAMQRVHISQLVNKYGDDYESMFRDIKLNSMQHSVATLKKLCERYHMHRDKNLLIRNQKISLL